MPNQLGVKTYNNFLKTPEHLGLTQEFQQDGLNYTLTFSADVVSLNVITGYVANQQVSVTFATSAANTYNLLAAAIGAVAGVLSVSVNAASRIITVKAVDQSAGIAINSFVVTLGASQPTVTIAVVDNRVQPGQPVMLLSTGKVAPLNPAAADLNNIGIALDSSRQLPDNNKTIEPEVVTVLLRGYAMETCQASEVNLAIGPIQYAGYDSVKKQIKVASTSTTVTNQYGWAIDAGTSIGDQIRVIVKN